MLTISKIKAITLDLDDTLWPIWPAISRAEIALVTWLAEHAPGAASTFADPVARLAVREHVLATRPEIGHDMSAVRREILRHVLHHSKEDVGLVEPAFEVFFAARMQVDLYDDALPALAYLAARWPVVAVSNGNADVVRVGLGKYFKGSFSATSFGVGKPDPRIFHAAASSVEVNPDEVLHIGDDAALDVLGGLNAGMQTVWLNRDTQAWSHEAQPHATVTTLYELCELLRALPGPSR
jgi:HAD superfamily hydrolase (TIGR01509 family)